MRRRPFYVLAGLLIAVVVFGFAVLGAALYVRFSNSNVRMKNQLEFNRIVCEAINNQNHLITLSLIRSRKNLPKLTYYRQHPDELSRALFELDQQIKQFRPRTCAGVAKGGPQ